MAYYNECGGTLLINGNPIFTRNIIVESTNINSIRNRFKNKDCYVSAFQYDSQNRDEANLYGAFYLDLDYEIQNDTDLKIIQYDLAQIVSFFRNHCGIPLELINIYFSGCKGFHILIDPIIFGISPDKNLNLKYKQFASYIKDNTINYKTIDTKIYDRVRLFRMVNSINGKTNLYKTKIPYEMAVKCSYSDLMEYAKAPKLLFSPKPYIINKAKDKFIEICSSASTVTVRKNSRFNSDGKKYDLCPCIKNMLETEARKGSRNNTCVLMASSLLQSGYDSEETLSMLLQWNDTYNTSKLHKKEIEATVSSATKEYNAGKGYGCSSIKELGFCVGKECRNFR